MGWLSFLQSNDFDPAVFEKELAVLAKKITTNERNVNKYRYQQQNLRNTFIFYGSCLYMVLSSYVFAVNGFSLTRLSWTELSLLLLSPGVISFLYKVLSAIYTMRITRVEAYIESLKSQHTEKIDELKERTQFSSTQALLQRFSDGNDLSAQLDEELREKQRQLEEIKTALNPGNSTNILSCNSAMPQRGWLDNIIDKVVGSDELNPMNRYALICANCSSHNGLAPPNKLPEQVKYICPRCGYINNATSSEVKDEKNKESSDMTTNTLSSPKENKNENKNKNENENENENEDEKVAPSTSTDTKIKLDE